MSWIDVFQQEFSDDLLDYSDEPRFLLSLFRGVLTPPLYLNAKGRICLPEQYCVLMGGSETLFRVLMQPDLFLALPVSLKRALLDVLFLLLHREPYDLVRLQFVEEVTRNESYGLCRVLLKLLSHTMEERDGSMLAISKRIVHCVGLAMSVGASAADLKKLLMHLRTPSELSLSILQAFALSLKSEPVGVKKATPACFFSFGGSGAGLGTSPSAFPFAKEFQFCTWFRIEAFHEHDPSLSTSKRQSLSSLQQLLLQHDDFQHLLSWQNASHRGLDLYFENSTLVLSVSQNARTEPLVVRLKDTKIRRGVWYFLSLRHAKPKFSFISNDELSISIDEEVVYCDSVRFPTSSSSSAGVALAETEFFLGRNLDGQMGPMYFFHETLSPQALSAVRALDSGRGFEGQGLTADTTPTDLMKGVFSSADRKFHAIFSKVSMSFHPLRTHQGYALDIHSGRHALMGSFTSPWHIVSPRDLLSTMGGVSCLLPLLPKLLIETAQQQQQISHSQSETIRSSSASPCVSIADAERDRERERERGVCGLGTTLAELCDDDEYVPSSAVSSARDRERSRDRERDRERENAVLDSTVTGLVRHAKEDCHGEGALSLFVTILARSISSHRRYQQELLFNGGVEMIEYALSCLPAELLQNESEKCVLSLVQLKNAAVDIPALEWRVTKSLLCNISLWYTASASFLTCLMSVMLALVRAKPDIYLKLLGVQPFLDALEFFAPIAAREETVASADAKNKNSRSSAASTTASDDSKAKEHKKPSLSIVVAEPSSVDDADSVPASVSLPVSREVSPKEIVGENGRTIPSSVPVVATTPIAVAVAVPVSASSAPSSGKHRHSQSLSSYGDFAGKSSRASLTPTGRRPSIRKLRSFRLALSETLNDDEEEDFEGEAAEILGEEGSNNGERASFSGLSAKKERRRSSILSATDLENAIAASAATELSPVGARSFSSPRPLPPLPEGCDNEREDDFTNAAANEQGEDDDDEGEETALMLSLQTNSQRKQIRDFLESMLTVLVLQGCSEKEVAPLLDYLATCKNKQVVNELAQLLLFLIMEGGNKIILAIISSCNGVEEFASFVLLSFVQQPFEELRYTGIRILTHFYQRLELLGSSSASSSVLGMSLKRKSHVRRAFLMRNSSQQLGLQHLQLCGGMALLCELVTAYSEYSTELTYAALLEMLLTKPGSASSSSAGGLAALQTRNPLALPLVEFLEATFSLSSSAAALGNTLSTSSATVGTVSLAQSATQPGRARTGSYFATPHSNTLRMTQSPAQTMHFAAHYLALDRMHDESADLTNALVLPIFFELLPKLPLRIQEQVYTDLLALLKHSTGHRQAFVSCPSWHLSMYDLVRSLIPCNSSSSVSGREELSSTGRLLSTLDLVRELELSSSDSSVNDRQRAMSFSLFARSHSRAHSVSFDSVSLSAVNSPLPHPPSLAHSQSLSGMDCDRRGSVALSGGASSPVRGAGVAMMSTPVRNPSTGSNISNSNGSASDASSLSQHDLWFDLGMKIYSTLLMHAVESRFGWREVDRCVAPSLDNDVGHAVIQSVVSCLLNELTFNMKSKYKELQRLAKSANSLENQLATDKLENVLSILVTSMHIALVHERCVNPFASTNIPAQRTSVEEVARVNKLRVQCFNELARDLYIKKLEVRGVNLEAKASMVFEYDLAAFSLTETRQLLEDTEIAVRARLLKECPSLAMLIDAEKTTQAENQGTEEELLPLPLFLDLEHVWQDITADTCSSNTSSSSGTSVGSPVPAGGTGLRSHTNSMDATANPASLSAGSTSTSAAPSSFKSIEELLHPLGRLHDLQHGRLVLTLQALRFFDVIFWPSVDSALRNTDMLRFVKDSATMNANSNSNPNNGGGVNANNAADSSASSTSASSSSFSSSTANNNRAPLTIFSSTMRMSLYTLTQLSPVTHLAVLNVKRLRAMMISLDRIPPQWTPTLDWLLATIAHVTLHLQRVIIALSPVFALLGMDTNEMRIPLVGPWEDSFDEFDKLTQQESMQIFAALDNAELKARLQSCFNSSMGRNLIRNVRSCLRLLIDSFDVHSSKLQAALEERTYNALYVLVEQIKADAQLRPTETRTQTQKDAQTHTQSRPTSSRKFSQSFARARSFRWENIQEAAPIASSSTAVNSASSSVAAAVFPSAANDGDGNASPFGYSQSSRSASFASERGDFNAPSSSVSFAPAAGREDTTSNADAHDQTTSSQTSAGVLAGESSDTPFEESFSGFEIVLLLKWLRYPYFFRNPFRNVAVVKAIEALDFLETRAVQRFVMDCKELKESLEDHQQQVSIKSIEELTELKELSRDVHEMMIDRQQLKLLTHRQQESLKAKNVASRWHDTLQDFEQDWSLWRLSLTQSLQERIASDEESGIAHFQLAKHCDLRMRNILLTRVSEPVSHRNAAYMESKLKDQLQYLLLQHSEGKEVDLSDVSEEQKAKFFELIAGDKNNDNDNENNNTNNEENDSTKATNSVSVLSLSRSALTLKLAASSAGKMKSVGAANSNGSSNGWEDEDYDNAADLKAFEADNSSNSNNLINSSGGNNNNNNGGNAATNSNTSTLIGTSLALATSFFSGAERRPAWSYLFPWASDEKTLFVSSQVTQIQVDQVISGVLLLTNKCLYFHCKRRLNPNTHTQARPLLDTRWFLDRLCEAYSRRYLLQNCAIELFFLDGPAVFLAFPSLAELQRFFRVLRNQPATTALLTPKTLNPRHLFKNSPWTELWRKRLISNFEYLMRLNIMAGRSFNDITQYPVFPWVLKDYTSEEIDLKNHENYRDLSKPVGALEPSRLNDFLERYRSFDDDTVPKFMYGSHYSSAGVIMHYLLRQEPFTTLAVALQGGRFDCPDRLFFDIKRTWHGVNHSMSDVKELIPEFFCCPEMFINTNRLPLGELQEGGEVNHVVLPPWAKTPFDFVRINRDALESDYVSDHLHEWIDLIFGYKQTGVAAKEANNVFYYLTYEHAIDIEAIEDPLQKEAAKAQVTHFGQTPSQLLQREHVKRLPKDECILPLCTNIGRIPLLEHYTPAGPQTIGRGHGAVIALRCVGDKLVTVHADFGVGFYRWIVAPDVNESLPFTIKIDKLKHLPSSPMSTAENLLRGHHTLPPLGMHSLSSEAAAQFASSRVQHIAANGEAFSAQPSSSSTPSVLSSWKSAWMGITAQLNPNASSSAAATTTTNTSTSPSPAVMVPLSPMRAQSVSSSSTLYQAMQVDKRTRSSSLISVHTHAQAQAQMQRRGSSPAGSNKRRGSFPSSSHNNNNNSSSGSVSSSAALSAVPLMRAMGSQHVSLSVSDLLAQGRVFSCGYWDNSLKVHGLDSMKELASQSSGHLGGVSCVAQGSAALSTAGAGGNAQTSPPPLLITGGYDATLRVWMVEKPSLAASMAQNRCFTETISEELASITSHAGQDSISSSTSSGSGGVGGALECVHTLWGHRSPVQCISYATDLDIVFSGGSDGLLCVHTVRQGQFVRSMTELLGSAVDVVLAASSGYLLAHCWATQQLALYWVNGEHLKTVITEDKIECMLTAGATGNILVCGTSTGRISFRQVWDLEEIHYIDIHEHGSVKCLWFAEDQQFLFAGSNDGSFTVITDRDKIASYTIQKPLLV